MNNIRNYKYPEWQKFEQMVSGIFEREYYTNHGPLAREFESQIATKLNVKHAICMSNMGIGIMIAVKALDLKGKIIVPDFGENIIFQSLIWAGLEPIYLKVDDTYHLNSFNITNDELEKASAILVSNNFGNCAEINAIEKFAIDNNKKIIYISSDAFNQKYEGINFGSFGNLELFSLNEKNLVNAIDASVITTNDDHLAARLRNIRSSYGAGQIVSIPFTGNGRISEIQAGMGLLSLNDLENNVLHNQTNFNYLSKLVTKNDNFSFLKNSDKLSNENYQRLIIKLNNTSLISKNEVLGKLEIDDYLNYYAFNPINKEAPCYLNENYVSHLIEIPIDDNSISNFESFNF